jgi:hypothetical protein
MHKGLKKMRSANLSGPLLVEHAKAEAGKTSLPVGARVAKSESRSKSFD